MYIVLWPLILFPHPSRFVFDFLPQIFSNLSFTLMVNFQFPYYFSHFLPFSSFYLLSLSIFPYFNSFFLLPTSLPLILFRKLLDPSKSSPPPGGVFQNNMALHYSKLIFCNFACAWHSRALYIKCISSCYVHYLKSCRQVEPEFEIQHTSVCKSY